MSREQDQFARKQMRVGVRGENVLPPLEAFRVTQTIMNRVSLPAKAGKFCPRAARFAGFLFVSFVDSA